MLKHSNFSLNARLVAGVRMLCVLLFLSCATISQQADLASLHGMVRDAQGNPVADASVTLEMRGRSQILTASTDARGSYSFATLHDGLYAIRVAKSGYSDAEVAAVFIAPRETKSVDLILGPVKKAESANASSPQFFDQPQFTVAGVTDTTSLGGHGSNTTVRTRDTLAKETASLGKLPPKTSATETTREKSLRDKVEHDPDDFNANYELGQLLIDNGRATEAIRYLEHAAAKNPADYANTYALALANAHAGNYDRARDQAQALLALHDKPELHHLLADVNEKLGDSLEAVHHYQRAAELDPSEPYLFDWGSELLLHHAPEPALEVFANGSRRFPHSTRMLLGIGAAWFARGSYEKALQQICEASDLDPGDPIPYMFLGKMLSAEAKPSGDLVEKLRRFVSLLPQNPDANYYYAVALWKTRKDSDKTYASQEESLLNRSVHLNQNFAAAYLQLGILHADEGDDRKAIENYEQALRIDPQMEEGHYRLAQAFRQVGEADKAREELHLYEQLVKKSNEKLNREQHEIKQFVYILRDHPAPNAQ